VFQFLIGKVQQIPALIAPIDPTPVEFQFLIGKVQQTKELEIKF